MLLRYCFWDSQFVMPGIISRTYADEKPAKLQVVELRMDKLSGFILSFDIARTSNFAAAALGNLHVRIWKVDSGEYIHELIFQEAQSDQTVKS